MAKSKTSHDTASDVTQSEPEPAVPAPEPPPRRTEFYPQAHAPLTPAEEVAPLPSIDGLDLGVQVRVLSANEERVAIVTKVYDAGLGDVAVLVLEPVAPIRPERLVFANKEGVGPVEGKTWAFPSKLSKV